MYPSWDTINSADKNKPQNLRNNPIGFEQNPPVGLSSTWAEPFLPDC